MNARHFLLLGYCAYDLVRTDDGDALRIVPGSGHGILRNQGDKTYSASFAVLPAHLRELARPGLPDHAEQIADPLDHPPLGASGLYRHQALRRPGHVIGECRFLGLYTAAAYHESPRNIPILRRKMDAVMAECDYVENSYKKNPAICAESYPRDELFEIRWTSCSRLPKAWSICWSAKSAPVPAHRPVSALCQRAGVCAARQFQHRSAAENRKKS